MLRNVNEVIYWIGGSACAGKSTLAKMYAEKFGLESYSCDEHFNEHLKNISVNEQPAMYKVSTMNPNETFYTRDIEEQLRMYVQSFKEDFSFVINDLVKRSGTPIVVEGNQLLPSLVLPYLEERHKAIWIIPTESFQRKYYQKRNWIQTVLRSTEDPAVAFDNWMTRDALFAKLVYQEATDLKLNVLKVDGRKGLRENFELIESYFSIK
jgi:2-phosphoglycerate kinase